jgi:predicted ATPase
LKLQYDADCSNRQVLVDALGFSPVLVVLDTCEHLIDSVSELAEFLVAQCPTLSLLCTSRGVLSSPSSAARSVDTLGDAAVELFALRAAHTRGGFELTEENRPIVEEICGQLDGVPLAVELAAARAATLDPAELLARLRDVFRVVRGASTGRAQRHQTLEATIEWSYRLLDLAERTLFDRLSVFLGAFTLNAAEEVCAGDDVDPLDIVDVLERLVDKSMVTTVDERSLRRRFRLLDTTRAYAALQLDADGDTTQLRQTHARYFAASLIEAEPRIWGPTRVRGRVLADLPNFRQAAEWAVETQDVEIAVALARLGRVLSNAGRFDGVDWLGHLAELSGFDDHPDALTALTALVGQHFFAGNLDRALTLLERGLDATKLIVSPFALVPIQSRRGRVLRTLGTIRNAARRPTHANPASLGHPRCRPARQSRPGPGEIDHRTRSRTKHRARSRIRHITPT